MAPNRTVAAVAALVCGLELVGCSAGTGGITRATTSAVAVPSSAASSHVTSARTTRTEAAPSHRNPTSRPPRSLTPSPSHRPAGRALPLPYPTGPAQQVITVVAASSTTTRARLQAWRRAGAGWRRVGPVVPAWLGYAGFSQPASEQSTATPTGSFTLTRAFGALPNPGTRLPYRRTTPADWWISQPGPLYNTLQHCAADCPFTQGPPNEHLRFELPYYDYAAVIDYNTANAPGGVQQGRGSAFFLHVTVHQPTQGCVSVPRPALVRILRWLRPHAHPRIVMGVA